MPLTTETELDFEPIDTGDMSEIPPDLPKGEWVGSCVVTPKVTQKGAPMLMLKWTAEEDNTGENADQVGNSAPDFLTFMGANDPNAKWSKMAVKALCEAYEIDLPDTSSLKDGSFASLEPFVEALESTKRVFWTTVEKNRKDGTNQTKIHYTQPGKKLKVEEGEGEEDEKPKAKAHTNGAPKKKVKK